MKKSDEKMIFQKYWLLSMLNANSFSTAEPGNLCAKLCTTMARIAMVLKAEHSSFDNQLFMVQLSFIMQK